MSQTAAIPIYSELDIEDYRQPTGPNGKSPRPIPGAQIAWSQPYPGTDQTAVAYSMQWDNPRPAVPILSIDLVSGPDRRGVRPCSRGRRRSERKGNGVTASAGGL